jgi:hypothetical protein
MIKLTAKDFKTIVDRNSDFEFPKYSKPILNIATQNSQATRVSVVGSMKELFTEFLKGRGKTVEDWKKFYFARDGEQRIEAATDKLYKMLNMMPLDRSIFTRELAKKYIVDLILYKTHFGMSGEYFSAKAAAKYFDLPLKWSTADDERQGIDAWFGEYPVQVKPHDSVKMNHVRNHADVEKTIVVTYETKKQCCYIHNPEFIEFT